MGYLNFDGVRYWDHREKESFHFKPEFVDPNSLPSDSYRRTDRLYLAERPVEEAQEEKERLENL